MICYETEVVCCLFMCYVLDQDVYVLVFSGLLMLICKNIRTLTYICYQTRFMSIMVSSRLLDLIKII